MEGEIIEKGMIAGILESKEIGNCSNRGLSYWHKGVMIVSDIDECKIFDITSRSELVNPCIVIKKKIVCGEEYIYAEPLDDPDSGNCGWMMGGSYIHSCDSRFSRNFSQYPIPLHDRQETQAENEMMSR